MTTIDDALKSPLAELLLSVADDKFVLGQRNADWTGLAPILEEDIAFSALAQDDLAHAKALYEFIANELGRGDGDADRLAYGRRPEEYRCAALVELHDEFNWAMALVRLAYFAHFDVLRLGRLAESAYAPLAALAARILAEARIHTEHADQWLARLGHAQGESHRRVQMALDALAPQAVMLFEMTPGVAELEAADLYPRDDRDAFERWRTALEEAAYRGLLEVRLPRPDPDARGGRRGQHSAGFGALLEELTEVYRVEPGAAW
jgi:ring-1,2-phenylacetyl-CoA epoxidase subunit PaaC